MKTLALMLAMAGLWPQWRGPARDGHASSFQPPATWPKTLQASWSAEIGEGYASPVADAERVCGIARQGEDEVVSCYDRSTGKQLWTDRYRSAFQKNSYAQRMAPAPFSTPTIDGGRLFALGSNAILSAYDLKTGKLAWRSRPQAPPSTKNLFCGTTASPLVDEGRLIVFRGDDSQGELLALDPSSGKSIWATQSLRPAYSSPVAAVIGGVRQYVMLTTDSIAGVDASTGKVLWTYPFEDQWRENILTPVIDGDRVLVSGVRKTTMLLQPVKGAKWSVNVVWQAASLPLYMSNPVADSGLLYGLTSRDKGRLFTLDMKKGSTLWTSEGRFADQVALAIAGKWLLVLNEKGELVVMDRNAGKPLEVARYQLAQSSVYAQPVLAGKQIVIKDERSLRAFLVP